MCDFSDQELKGQELLDDDSIRDDCNLKEPEGIARDYDENLVQIELHVKTKSGDKRKQKFNSLANANDNGASFKAIATWIEKNYKLL